MKRCVVALVALLAMLAGIWSVEARGPYGTINVGNWKGGAFTNDQNGEFSHCGATAMYQNGIYFVVMIDGKPSWSLGFAHDSWTMSSGKAFPIQLTFDGQTPVNVHGIAVTDKLLRVPMPDTSNLIAQFRKAKSMSAYAHGQLLQFNLDQTGQLLPTLANCVAKVKQFGVANAGDFSVPKPAARVAAAGAEPAGAPEAKPGKLSDQNGTGFVVSANGHLVTNHHVIDRCVGDIQGKRGSQLKVRAMRPREPIVRYTRITGPSSICNRSRPGVPPLERN